MVSSDRTVEQLRAWLIDNGFSDLPLMGNGKNIFLLDIDLLFEDNTFIVGYSERGKWTEIVTQTSSEAEACTSYLGLMLKNSWFLARFASEQDAEAAAVSLESNGIRSHRNDIPPDHTTDGKYRRLFCMGSDLVKAKTILGL
jgi:hypothetical protein